MHRHSHRRRHRSSRRALHRLGTVALVVVTLVGLVVLIQVSLLTPVGRWLVAGGAAVAAIVALMVVSCTAGRIAAALRNAFALQAGRSGLEKLMRERDATRNDRGLAGPRVA